MDDTNPVTKPIIWSEFPADSPSALSVRQLVELCGMTDWLIRIHSEMAQFCFVSGDGEEASLHVDRIFVISSVRNGLILGANTNYSDTLALFREEGDGLVKLVNNKDYVALGDAVLRQAGLT